MIKNKTDQWLPETAVEGRIDMEGPQESGGDGNVLHPDRDNVSGVNTFAKTQPMGHCKWMSSAVHKLYL